MKIATWNVNSIRARLPVVTGWVEANRPDVLLFQELKCETAVFPRESFEALGYEAAVLGQKAYNGVALLARRPLEISDILEGLPGEESDAQARYLEATVGGIRVASLYLPNGNPVDTDKYPYKLRWLARLRARAAALLATERPFVLGGDYNVIPEPEDVYSPDDWREDALFRLETRLAWRALVNLGLTEAYRALHPHRAGQAPAYSFWDYQAGCWPRNQGLRIDHFLLSPVAADRLVACTIDSRPRGLDKASDHVPVVVELNYSP
ncbi:MAG: exodeoxyribonuclease III [Rhodospirillaceae bacterium]